MHITILGERSHGTEDEHPIPVRPATSRTRESTDIFRVLVESVRDYAIFVLDPEGRVLTWNLGAETLKGYSKEEIIGKHFSKFYPPEAVASGWPERELELAEKQGRFADEGASTVILAECFDVCGIAIPRMWEDKASLIVKRIRQIGTKRVLYGSDAATPDHLPKEALERWHQLPLTPEEFRLIENNATPYIANWIRSAGAH